MIIRHIPIGLIIIMVLAAIAFIGGVLGAFISGRIASFFRKRNMKDKMQKAVSLIDVFLLVFYGGFIVLVLLITFGLRGSIQY